MDNLDYVLRDAYMCGVAIGAVDIDRLMYYTFFTDKGLTLHKSGLTALNMFLNARLYMYTNVYYHRTTRAIDEHLKELFKDTMAALFPYNPVENLAEYLELTDWSLLEAVREVGQGRTGADGHARPRMGRDPFPRGKVEDGLRRHAFDACFRKRKDHHRQGRSWSSGSKKACPRS